nr:proline-rich receptor-like protein kinase PERK9 [Camelus dromedarius]
MPATHGPGSAQKAAAGYQGACGSTSEGEALFQERDPSVESSARHLQPPFSQSLPVRLPPFGWTAGPSAGRSVWVQQAGPWRTGNADSPPKRLQCQLPRPAVLSSAPAQPHLRTPEDQKKLPEPLPAEEAFVSGAPTPPPPPPPPPPRPHQRPFRKPRPFKPRTRPVARGRAEGPHAPPTSWPRPPRPRSSPANQERLSGGGVARSNTKGRKPTQSPAP